MEIKNSSIADIPVIFSLYRAAVNYQRKNGYNLWPEFEQTLIAQEIAEKRLWKIIDGNDIACTFSVAYNDPLIWEEKDKEPSVYLHRIATNPLFKGRGIMQLITGWAIEHAKQQHKQFVRMDTWGDNESLKKYYVGCGFTYLKQRPMPAQSSLPQHYWGLTLSLFEIKV